MTGLARWRLQYYLVGVYSIISLAFTVLSRWRLQFYLIYVCSFNNT